MKKIKVLSVLITMIVGIVIFEQCKPSNKAAVQNDGIIRGYVYTDVTGDKQKNVTIYLPDVKITVKDDKGVIVDSVLSRLDGNYATNHLKKGRYQLCLSKSGFTTACYNVTVSYASNHPGPLKIGVGDSYLWGCVKQKDSSVGYYDQGVFDVHIDTKIGAEIKGALIPEVRCNTRGYYVLPVPSYRESGKVTAICEKTKISAIVNGQRHIDMSLPNSNPKIISIVAHNDTGRTLLRTRAGKKIKLVANVKDADNNTLHYKWIPFGKFPTFVSIDGPEVVWELPTKNGNYEMDLMVVDSFGGASYKRYSIVAGDGTVNFSGIVSNIDGSGKIANALIKVNGQYTTTSDAKGYFTLKVPENNKERYVLNVIKPGYALCSKIYMNDVDQEEYKLVATSTDTANPATDIVITELPDKYTNFDRDNSKRIPARLRIPKNSIVDSSGHLVTVAVNVSIRSIDITKGNGQMPGDFGGEKQGKNVRLESYGAVDVQIRDHTNPNIKYKLADTAKAELYLPIPSSKLASAADSISFWDYNDSTGLWEHIGKAKKTGGYYKGITHRFSVLNADLEFNNGTYIVLIDNPLNSVFTHRINPSDPISISVATVVGGTVTQGHHVLNNVHPSDVINGIPVVNLPGTTHIRVSINSGTTLIRTLDFNSGPIIPGSAQLPPPNPVPPYDPTAVQQNMFDDDQNQLDVFLTGEENDYGGAARITDADAYYTLIGASNYTKDVNLNTVPAHAITFAEWKAKNGYNADGTGDINSVYFNAGDLGFWRGMHEKTNGGTISYYVSNFNNDNDAIQDPQNVTNNTPKAFATVCMEYSPITSGINITKFYVFDAAGNLSNFANLDGNNAGPDNGHKFVPGLCITCHGGEILHNGVQGYGAFADGNALQAYFASHTQEIPNFLPFDAQSFQYSSASGYTRPDQEGNIYNLNQTVLSTQRTQAIVDFINAAYTGGSTFIDNSAVGALNGAGSWNTLNNPVNGVTPKQLYTEVIGTSCRTCHIARTDPGLWWDTQPKFAASSHTSSIQAYACPVSTFPHAMPNSKVTFLNFWNSSPNRPETARNFLNSNAACQ